jgi:hypothetical protein
MSPRSFLLFAVLLGGCFVANPAPAQLQTSAMALFSSSSKQPKNFSRREKLAQRCKQLGTLCVDSLECCPPLTCENSLCSFK